jgi:hypothetical protein
MSLICLIAPYSDRNPRIVAKRMATFYMTDAALCEQGNITISCLDKHSRLPFNSALRGDYDFWKRQAETMIKVCDKVVVIKMDGWETSSGVTQELALAKSLGKPIEYIEPVLPPVHVSKICDPKLQAIYDVIKSEIDMGTRTTDEDIEFAFGAASRLSDAVYIADAIGCK